MASGPGKAVIPGRGPAGRGRQLKSWIEAFVDLTDNLESAKLYRKWTAIAALAATMEQKIWVTTTSPIYPNLYTILVGPPGVGKTRTIMKARELLASVPDFYIAPLSMTMASMVEFLAKCKRFKQRLSSDALEYNTMTMLTDDWSVFMSSFEKDLIAGLTQFYDCWPYRRTRTTKDIDHDIARPQLNLLAGTTPSDLFDFMPVSAWGQGFTSRVILIYSNDEPRHVDDFAQQRRDFSGLQHDLNYIWEQTGEFQVTDEFRDLALRWKEKNGDPKPTHPKLVSYNSRRRTHIYKLAMVHAIDRGGDLVLRGDDFSAALAWLREAEMNMEAIFDEGQKTVDDAAMDEIVEFVRRTNGTGMMRGQLVRKTTSVVAITKVRDVLELLVVSGRLKMVGDRFFAGD